MTWQLHPAFSQAIASSLSEAVQNGINWYHRLSAWGRVCTEKYSFVYWLILFEKGWRKALRQRITSSCLSTEQIYPACYWTLPGKQQHLWMHLGRLVISTWRRCDTRVAWARRAALSGRQGSAICPGFPDVWQAGWNSCMCQRAGQNL